MSLKFSSQGIRSNIQINQKEIFRFGDAQTPEVFINNEWVKIVINDSDQYDELLALAGSASYSAIGTDLIFDTSGNLYWAVCNYSKNDGSLINTAYVFKITPSGELTTLAEEGTIGSFETALAFDTSGNLYWAIANYNTGSFVYKITPGGTRTTFTSHQADWQASATALAFDTYGNLYWALCHQWDGSFYITNSYVYKITPGGTRTTFTTQQTIGAFGTDLIFDTSGNLYWAVMNRNNNAQWSQVSYVYKITPAQTKTIFASQSTTGGYGTDLIFDADGNLYWAVSNFYNGTTYNLTSYVYKITPALTKTTFASINTFGSSGAALAFDTSGNLYWAVSNYHNGTTWTLSSNVYKITVAGVMTPFTTVKTFGSSQTSIKFDSVGNFYWAVCNQKTGQTDGYEQNSYLYTKQLSNNVI